MDIQLVVLLLVLITLSRGDPDCLTHDEHLPGHFPPLGAYGLSTKFGVQATMFTQSIPIQYHIVEPSGTGSITDYHTNKARYHNQWNAAIQTHLAEYNTAFAAWGANFRLLPVKYIASNSKLHNCYSESEASLEPELQKHAVDCSTQYADWPTCGTINIYLNEGRGGICRLQVTTPASTSDIDHMQSLVSAPQTKVSHLYRPPLLEKCVCVCVCVCVSLHPYQ